MYKRGQATLFIILGIVLVVIIVLLFTTKTIELPRRSVESSQVSSVDAYVESCVGKEVKDLLLGLRKQGGVYNTGGYYFDGRTYFFYVTENTGSGMNKHIENEETMRNYISRYTESLLNSNGVCDPCKQFSNIQCGNFGVTTFSSNEKIMINVNNDKLIFSKGGSEVNVGEMSLVINDDFFKEFEIVKRIADEYTDSREFDVDNYLNKQYDRDLHVKMNTPTSDPNLKIFWVGNGELINEETFYFAVKR